MKNTNARNRRNSDKAIFLKINKRLPVMAFSLPLLGAIAVSLVSHASNKNSSNLLALSTSVVISQVYGGGGNSGATYTNDFIELFNRGASPVSVNGWSVQYASATGTTWAVTSLTNVTIQPGQYYLVQEAQGAGGTTPLPTPDAMGTIAMSATAGKVALVNSITALSGACPTGASIIDFVGYGVTASCFEGSGPTPAPSNTTAVLRGANGCTETDTNATDFSAAAPTPRNTSSTMNPCGTATPTPTPTPTPGPSPTPTPTPTPTPVPITPICQIQGIGTASLLAGANVTTEGVVTGLRSNGFFIQQEACDVDTETSDGIFVFTSSAPPAGAAIGNSVQVSANLQEFVPNADPNQNSLTELSGAITVNVLSTGNPLPASVVLTASETTNPSEISGEPLDTLEEYEGMRVTVSSLTVVAPTLGNINEPNATVTSNGVFYGVVTTVARPFREAGIAISDHVPAPNPPNVPRFDENPERIRVDSDAQPGTTAIDVPAGTVITNVTGPLDYSFRTYTILPDAATPPIVGALPAATAVPAPTATELTIASFNMQRFFNDVNDPGSEPVLTTTAFTNRLNKASLVIRNIMQSPDVIGVVEVENQATLDAVANKVNADAGTPNDYQGYLVEGNDIGGIDVAFLIRSSRIAVVDVTQIEQPGCDPTMPTTCNTFINPNTGNAELLNDRPPLVLRATIAQPGTSVLPFTVIVNHLRSLIGIDSTEPNGSGTEGESGEE